MKTPVEVSRDWQGWVREQSDFFGVDFHILKDVISKEVKWFGTCHPDEYGVKSRMNKTYNNIDLLLKIDPLLEWRMKFLAWIIA